MSPLQWYAILVALSAGLLAAFLVGVKRFGAYAVRMEKAADRAENAAIQLYACIGWMQDMEAQRKARVDHPVVPPDSLPDEMEGAA